LARNQQWATRNTRGQYLLRRLLRITGNSYSWNG
jgi:hypothetical protein